MGVQQSRPMFDPSDANYLSGLIRMKDPTTIIPYCKVYHNSLGGCSSLHIKASADNNDNWINNIYHNSKYAIFSLTEEKGVDKLELISSRFDMPKFRKCRVKNLDDVSDKIIAYFNSL